MSEKPVESFFHFTESGHSRCLVVDCKSELKSKKPSALLRHIQQRHASKLSEVETSNITRSSLPYLRLSTIYTCVKHVTVCGRPLEAIYDESFQEFLADRLKKLRGTSQKLVIDRELVKRYVNDTAEKIRAWIRDEMKNKTVSLMMDIATRHMRSILGISLQTIHNGEICVRTIAMERILSRHTSANLKNLTLNVLDKYEITPHDVMSITTDNGSNMIAMSKEINECVVMDMESIDENDEDDMETMLAACADISLQERILNRAAEELQTIYKPVNFSNTTNIRCGSHTFQLAVNIALTESNCSSIIDKVRELVKELRLQRILYLLETSNTPIPSLDNNTRWFSKYTMVILLCSSFLVISNYIFGKVNLVYTHICSLNALLNAKDLSKY